MDISKAKAYIKLNDVTPYGSKIMADDIIASIKKHVRVSMFAKNTIAKVFDESIRLVKPRVDRYYYCVNLHYDGSADIYINFWERDTPEQWGSRMFEIKFTLKNAFSTDGYPILDDSIVDVLGTECLRKFNDRYAHDCADKTIDELAELLLDFTARYEFKAATANPMCNKI